jgi:hypothetical protein
MIASVRSAPRRLRASLMRITLSARHVPYLTSEWLPWTPRGIEIRGTAVALTDQEPPMPFLSREIIRIKPTKIVSWALDGPPTSRTV